MKHPQLRSQMDAIVARHDLLCHPFYQAWTAGKLRAEDLRRYAQEYYHHVAAFPTYLSALHSRLADGELRRSVLRNLCEEEIAGTAHSDLWLDFAEGMGATWPLDFVSVFGVAAIYLGASRVAIMLITRRQPVPAPRLFHAKSGVRSQTLRPRRERSARANPMSLRR